AIGHGDREILVRHGDRPQRAVAHCGLGQGFDDGREVGPGVGEYRVDSELTEALQKYLGAGRFCCGGHRPFRYGMIGTPAIRGAATVRRLWHARILYTEFRRPTTPPPGRVS